MYKKILLLFSLAFLSVHLVCGQKNFNNYLRMYPISEDPYIGYKTSYTPQETILLEASPIVRYSFYNNIVKGLGNGKCHVA